MRFSKLAIAAGALLGLAVVSAQAQVKIDPKTWVYGNRNNATTPTIEIWNPAMKKLKSGGQLFGGTIRGTDPRIYCAMANAGYDFTWVEMQHEHTTWEQVARMWRTCPDAKAVPGVNRDQRSVSSKCFHSRSASSTSISRPMSPLTPSGSADRRAPGIDVEGTGCR